MSAYFNNGCIVITDSPALHFASAGGFSVSFWLQHRSGQNNNSPKVFCRGSFSSANGWPSGALILAYSNTAYNFLVQYDRTQNDPTPLLLSFPPSAYTTGWHHWCITLANESSQVRLTVYIDGIFNSTVAGTGSITDPSQNISIGDAIVNGNTGSYQYAGEIAALTIFKRCLPQSDVSILALSGGIGTSMVQAGRVLFMPLLTFDNQPCTLQQAADFHGNTIGFNNSHGTVYGLYMPINPF